MRLIISICSNRPYNSRFQDCLDRLGAHLQTHGVKGVSDFELLGLQERRGVSLLPMGRENCLSFCLEKNATDCLFIDDDMEFPENLMDYLVEDKKQIIASNYRRKATGAVSPVASGLDKQPLYSLGKTGIEEVSRIGMGIFLINMDIIKKVPAPHFEILWNQKSKGYVSEDAYFCDKLRKSGYKIYVQHDLSLLVGHIHNDEVLRF